MDRLPVADDQEDAVYNNIQVAELNALNAMLAVTLCEDFDLTAHKCCCGCGEDVHNKLSPAKWRLTKTGDGSVSLEPSIGNWKYACQSHYWISENRVINAGPMSARAIEAVQRRDQQDRDKYIAQVNVQAEQGMSLLKRIYAQIARMLERLKALWSW